MYIIYMLYECLEETRVVWGGGAMEMAMAQAVQQKVTEVGGKESVAMESFGKALMRLRKESTQKSYGE